MASIWRARVGWSGTACVGAGVSTFYAYGSVPATWATYLHDFMAAVGVTMPLNLTFTIPGTADELDEVDEKLLGAVAIGSASPVNTTGSSGFTTSVGGRITWLTTGVHGGRRVRGTTYIVPMLPSYTVNNLVHASAIAALQDAANAYLTSMGTSAAVYGRPRPSYVNRKGVTKPALTGKGFPITGRSVPQQVTWLRSRRT